MLANRWEPSDIVCNESDWEDCRERVRELGWFTTPFRMQTIKPILYSGETLVEKFGGLRVMKTNNEYGHDNMSGSFGVALLVCTTEGWLYGYRYHFCWQ